MDDHRKVTPADRLVPGPPPSRERMDELARAVADGRYRVSPERVAEAILRSLRPGPPERRG